MYIYTYVYTCHVYIYIYGYIGIHRLHIYHEFELEHPSISGHAALHTRYIEVQDSD